MKGYFDHNATTPMHPAARQAWVEATDQYWYNASSLYREAAEVKHRLDDARERLAELLGCEPGRLIFTSGATESNNALVQWWAARSGPASQVLSSSVEHPSVAAPLAAWFPHRVSKIPARADSSLDWEGAIEPIRSTGPALVSVMAANNECGTLHPWRELALRCKQEGVPFHCDASQWIGKLPGDHLGECDYVTGSGHKFGGPKGVGFLMVQDEDERLQLARGGPQEEGRRAGTENYPAIEAMVTALEIATDSLPNVENTQSQLRDQFVSRVCTGIPGTKVVGDGLPRLWNTAMLILPAHDHRKWLGRLSQIGFAVSTGSACSAGDRDGSSLMPAIQAPPEEWRRVLRISGGWDTTSEAWTALAAAMVEVWESF
jgi:cysteine desulfurase